MKKLLILAAVASTVIFSACERKETVVVPTADKPATVAIPVPVAVPGPKGDAGAPGAPGAPGSSGSTTIITTPSEAPK